jgi:glyoxylase-like metal-dependent hydrolase (beta-lactamase superfamily II)
MLTLGDLTVTGLKDLPSFDIPLTRLLPDADPAALEGIGWLGPEALSDGIMHLAMRSWLIRMPGRTILVDTCVGAGKERALRPEWHRRAGAEYLAALAAEGLSSEDIDVVLCTHLHADHVGWNTRLQDGRWVPTFPNARYVAARTDYAHWEAATRADPATGHGCFTDSVLPVMEAGRMDLVEDGWDLGPGLTLAEAPGHSPGHLVMHAAHGPGGVFCGDVIHSPVQLVRPDWSSAFCWDPERSRRTRSQRAVRSSRRRRRAPDQLHAHRQAVVRRSGAAASPPACRRASRAR